MLQILGQPAAGATTIDFDFPNSHQHLTESEKILVNFALVLNTATLTDRIWAIKIPNLTARAEKFRVVLPRNRSLTH